MELAILSDEISLDLDEALDAGAAMGFRKYEIRCFDDYQHRVPYFKPDRESRLLERVGQDGVAVTSLTPGTFKLKLSQRDRIRRELEETLPSTCEMAVRLGAPTVIVFGFMRETNGDPEEAIAHLKQAGGIAAGYNLQLAVENEPGSYFDTGVNTAKAMRGIALDNVGINWDPANALVSGEVAYPVGYEAVRPWLRNVHLKDAIPVPPDKWENRLIGDGGVNWFGQLRALCRDASLPHLTLETHVFPLLESTREDLRRLNILFEAVRTLDAETTQK